MFDLHTCLTSCYADDTVVCPPHDTLTFEVVWVLKHSICKHCSVWLDQAAQEDEPSEEAADEDATPEKEAEKGDASADSPLDALARAAESVDSEAAAKGAAATISEEAAEGAPGAAGKNSVAAAADTGDFCDVQTAESVPTCRPF